MTATKQNARPASDSLLTTLRNVGRTPAQSLEDLQRIAETQADLLRAALLGPLPELPDYLPSMVSTLAVEQIPALPVAGLSYWSGHRWHIQVRSTDSDEERLFTVLHQLKHIIDHPVRQMATFTEANWDSLANHFVQQVLEPKGIPISA